MYLQYPECLLQLHRMAKAPSILQLHRMAKAPSMLHNQLRQQNEEEYLHPKCNYSDSQPLFISSCGYYCLLLPSRVRQLRVERLLQNIP